MISRRFLLGVDAAATLAHPLLTLATDEMSGRLAVIAQFTQLVRARPALADVDARFGLGCGCRLRGGRRHL